MHVNLFDSGTKIKYAYITYLYKYIHIDEMPVMFKWSIICHVRKFGQEFLSDLENHKLTFHNTIYFRVHQLLYA